METKTDLAKVRKQILKGRGVTQEKHTRRLITHDEEPAPFNKSPMMKYIELKHGDKLENLLWPGTIYEVAKRLGIDYSTVSKWRKIVEDGKFFGQFKED